MNKKYNNVIFGAMIVLILGVVAMFATGSWRTGQVRNTTEPATGQIAPDNTNTPTTPAQEAILKTISPTEFKDRLTEDGIVVLDVRTPAELKAGRIVEDPLNIDFYRTDFATQLNELDKNQTYLIYCHTGNRSGQTLDLMSKSGFKSVYNLDGGIDAWQAADLPVVKG